MAVSLDHNSGASEWKRQLVEAEARADALMSAPLTHSIECPGPDPGMGIELLKPERTKSQAWVASNKKETPLSRHAFAEKKRIKANKKTKAEAKRSVRSGSLRKMKTYFSPIAVTQNRK
jgi:hypothetical protein